MLSRLSKARFAIPKTKLLVSQVNRSYTPIFDQQEQVDVSIFQQNIAIKTEQGRFLAQQIAQATPENKFEKEQRYEIFIGKMMQLYRSEKRFKQKQNAAYGRMKSAVLISQTPVKQVLSEYNKLTGRGFNCEVLANSLDHLHATVHARGNNPKVYADYSVSEMDQSWRMEKVAQDLKFALTSENAFISGNNMGRISRKLGDLGYKNTEVFSLWFEKINLMLTQDQETLVAGPSFEETVFGSMKNFIPRHYIYQGFSSSEEFQQHIDTLVHFKTTQKKSEGSSEIQEIQECMGKLMDAAKEVRELQVDQQATILSLRDQFFKLQQAQDKHEFLQQNKYLMYDMLELQELLVKGGYISPEEALLGKQDTQDDKMERATQIFYDIVLNQKPELLSPQYNAYYEASVASQTPEKTAFLNEDHNSLNLKSLSNVLIGLADQALSFRRDVKDKDYPNKHYEDLLMPEERTEGYENVAEFERFLLDNKAKNVLMERTYLNAWKDFSNHSSSMVAAITKLVGQSPNDVEGQLHALRALSACRYESKAVRANIMSNVLNCKKSQVSQAAIVDGLVGTAYCSYKTADQDQVLKQLVDMIKLRELNFDQKVELVHALSMLKMTSSSILDSAIRDIDRLPFERTDNELTFKQFERIHETYQSLKLQGSKVNFKNKNLLSSLKASDSVFVKYQENKGLYDPLKQRVIAGLARGLNTDLNKVHLSQQLSLNEQPFQIVKPDIVTGIDGKKVALYVLSQTEFMKDTMNADGRNAHFMELNARGQTKNVVVPLDSVVSYDLQNFQMKLKDDFNMQKLLGGITKDVTPALKFSKFAQSLANSSADALSMGITDSNMDMFISQVLEVFAQKERADHLHELEQVSAANDELRFNLMKLSLIHDTKLSPVQQMHVKKCCFGENLSDLVMQMKKSVDAKKSKQQPAGLAKLFDFEWKGTRQSVELPNLSTNNAKKSITPELISQKFMQHGDYHQYDDWKAYMQQTYDQFNMMQLPEAQNKITLNYDKNSHKRKVPKGIFPMPNAKRQILQPAKNLIGKLPTHHDRFTEFEADPMQYMLDKEFEHSKTLEQISKDVSMMCNLQNLKHGLKSDYTDQEIVETMLLKLSFTDKLIEEHLGNQKAEIEPEYLPRDPEAFRRHALLKNNNQSPFNQFYLQEALKKGNVQGLFDRIQQIKHKDGALPEIQEKYRQIEDILMLNEAENEDYLDLSKGLDNYVQVKFDLKSLGVLDNSPEERRSSQSAGDFLHQERCRAEARLIKSKLIYKLHTGAKLTQAESSYLKAWQSQMANSSCLLDECMVPEQPSQMTIKDMSADDLYTLNSVPKVQINRDSHGKFAMNDLVVELSQVFDKEMIRNVELSCLQDSLKEQWGLSQDFKLVQDRNQEIGQVLNEFEELAWRSAGQFSERETQGIKEMISIGRGEDHFDRAFLTQDMESFDEFIAKVNDYDNRIELIEAWLVRKEREIKSRVNLPMPGLQKKDSEIDAMMESRYKPIREKLVAEMLRTDEFGNAKTQKAYRHLNSGELHQLTESLSVRLHLFNKNYPAFVPQVVRAVMEHPNLNNSDQSTLDTFCKMFELDWRGDQTLQNRDEFLATHPVYLHSRDRQSVQESIDADRVRSALQQACLPYLPQLTKKIMQGAE